MPALSDRWLDARNRLLASPAFQRFAATFPLTRPIARRRASAVFDLVAGFVYSQVLFAVVKLGILERLKPGPQRLDDVAAAAGLSPQSARTLLEAASAIGLLTRLGGGRFGLGPHGAALLASPAIAAMISHHDMLYRDLADPVALLKDPQQATELSRFWAYATSQAPAAEQDQRTAAYTELMSSTQSLVAAEILDAYPAGRHSCLLDIGGGDGTFLIEVAKRAPGLALLLFDLPPVAARAAARFAEAGLSHRARAIGGSFKSDPLPEGADLVSLVRVIHDHDDEIASRLLATVRHAIRPGGTLLLAEPMADTRGAEAMGAAYFGFYLMAMKSGRPRTVSELSAMLCSAGFENPSHVPTRQPLQTSLIIAHA